MIGSFMAVLAFWFRLFACRSETISSRSKYTLMTWLKITENLEKALPEENPEFHAAFKQG
jgi:hypothetical protein